MTNLKIGENNYTCDSEETVLDALLRQDVEISYACKKGTCHSCMLRCSVLMMYLLQRHKKI